MYFRSFEEIFDLKITSGFLSAIYAFLKHSLNTIRLNEIKIGKYRFIFEIEKVKDVELLFIILAERTDNLLELREDLQMVKDKFIEQFQDRLVNFNGEVTDFFEFDSKISEILFYNKKRFEDSFYFQINQIIEELKNFSSFVIASALLNQNGGVIMTSLSETVLSDIVRILEARNFTQKTDINELVTLEEFGILTIRAINDSLISVIQFKKKCPFETALIISKKFSKRIEACI